MSANDRLEVERSDASSDSLNGVVRAFEVAWQSGRRPAIENYLPVADTLPIALVLKLAQVDLRHQLEAGEAARAEDYLHRFPQLRSDPTDVLDLIAAEFAVRCRHETGWGTAEYLQRFPELATELSGRLQAGTSATPGATDAGFAMVVGPAKDAPDAPDAPSTPGAPEAAAGPDDPYATRSSADTIAAVVPTLLSIPGYEILGELGRGGMGIVYRARQTQLQRIVALKVVLGGRHAGAGERLRFRTEAEAIARLQHPNIVQIYDVGEHDGLPFFSLEFCAGGSLAQQLAATPLPPGEAAALLESLARGAQAAHEQGIIHRDLKPSNILLAGARGQGSGVREDSSQPPLTPDSRPLTPVPKISDFGLAKRLDEAGRTVTGAILGTPSYMAPEQAAGKIKELGPPCDIYALGAILYECLTGRPPFKAATVVETLRQVVNEEPVPPGQLQARTPRDLETICLTCLQKDPARRYRSAAALADDLQRYRQGEPVLARPTPAWERLAKWVRRKPVTAALIVVSVIAAFAPVAGYGLYQAQQAADAAQALRVTEQENVRVLSGAYVRLAREHIAGEKWVAANTELAKAREALNAQPELRADELRDEVQQLQQVVETRLQEQERLDQARRRVNDFRKAYDEALYLYTLFTGLDVARDRARIGTAARAALAVYELDGTGPAAQLERDRAAHQPAEHTRLASACYELLLIWAEAEADTPPAPAGAAKALAVLAQAEQLAAAHHLQSRTGYLHKARCLAQSKGQVFDAQAAEQAAPARAGRLDWFLAGLEHYRQGRFGESIAACDRVLAEDEDFWARYVKALALLGQPDWLSARAELTVCVNRCVQLGRPASWPLLMRGFASSELGYHPPGDAKRASADFAAAEQDFASACKLDTDPLVQYVGWANRGLMNVRRKQFARAADDLQQALKAHPDGLEAQVNLAWAYRGMQQWDEAFAALARALKQAPQLAILFESRGELHREHQDWPAARADFEQAIALERKTGKADRLPDNLVKLGQLLQRDGDHPAALACYEEALRLRPTLALAHRLRARALLAVDVSDRSGVAAAALDRYLALAKPPRADAYLARGLLHVQARQLPAAIEMYTLALALEPAGAATHCNRGWAYLQADTAPLALDDFEVGLRQAEAEADAATALDARIGRASARIRLRKLDQALADARAAEADAAKKRIVLDHRLLYHLARVYAQAAGQLAVQAHKAPARPPALAAERQAVCKKKALDCLLAALASLSTQERPAFWRTRVHDDPALATLRTDGQYVQLAARLIAARP